MHLNPSDTNLIGETIIKLAADYSAGRRRRRHPVGLFDRDQPELLDRGRQEELPEEVPEDQRSSPTVYGDDDFAKSTDEAQGPARSAIPNLKAIIAPTTSASSLPRKVVDRRRPDRQGQRHRARRCLRSSRSSSTTAPAQAVALWNPIDLGYSADLSGRHDLAVKKDEAKPGAKLSIGRSRRGHARRRELRRDGAAVRVRQVQHRGVLEDLSDRGFPNLPAEAASPCLSGPLLPIQDSWYHERDRPDRRSMRPRCAEPRPYALAAYRRASPACARCTTSASSLYPGEVHGADRRERRRQVDAGEDPHRHLPARRGRDQLDGDASHLPSAARRLRARASPPSTRRRCCSTNSRSPRTSSSGTRRGLVSARSTGARCAPVRAKC